MVIHTPRKEHTMARIAPSSRTSRNLVAALALTGLMVTASQAMALQPTDPGNGNPLPPNTPPTAALVATPNPVVVPAPLTVINPGSGVLVHALRLGTQVTFDAGGSRDPDGELTKYEWDLDGTPGYETTTFAPRATYRFGVAGVFPVKVRVTDNRGATAVATASVRAHYAPAARIVASATAAIPQQTVSFNGATSSDADGITKYEWDLDGNGTFEKTGAQQSTTFTTLGAHAVKLRVTDGLGATSVATASVRVHRAPTALVVSRPVAPAINQAVTLDASRSSDDGSIVKYEWDLNGDNTFETTTTGPMTTTVFTTPGTKRIGLKVTDNDGATDQTTLNLQVSNTPVTATARDTTAPRLRPSTKRLRVSKKGRATFRVTCPATEQICRVGVQLKGTKGALRGRTLARKAVLVQGGHSTKVTLTLSSKARRAAAHGAVKAQLVLTARDTSGNRAITRTAMSIRR